MRIIIDPTELIAASETLRACSMESADIGSALWACAQCAMPADVRGAVDHLVATVDRDLDSVATVLNARAVDLTNRAHIAASDSLVAAFTDSGYGAPAPTSIDGALASALVAAGFGAPASTSIDGALASALVAAGFGADGRTVITGGESLYDDFGLGAVTPGVISGVSLFNSVGIGQGNGGIGTLDATAPSNLWNNFSWGSPTPGGGNMADVFALLAAPVPTTIAGSINPRLLYNYKNDVMMQRAYPSGVGEMFNIVPFTSPWTNPNSVP